MTILGDRVGEEAKDYAGSKSKGDCGIFVRAALQRAKGVPQVPCGI